MHTSPPWQDRELCVLYIQGVFSTMTYSPAAHTNKACLGLRKKKKVSLFLAYILEVEGLNWYGLKERSSPRSLVYCRHSPVDVSLPAVTNGSKCHLLLWWFVRKKSDLVWQQWDKCQERHPRRWREDTLRRENKKNNTKTRNYQNSIQARMWQLRAGLLRPLMMGPRLSICEEDPDGCNVSTEWVSGFMPCHS